MNNYPLFTVIIPQKNRAEFLTHTIHTCMIQDYPNFEIIISDDFSDDNSVDIVKELMAIDSRIKLFAHEHHLGMRDNFEFALNQVRNGYVIALGGDDGLIPGCIWKMYQIITTTKKQLLTWPLAAFEYANQNNPHSLFVVKRTHKTVVKILKSKSLFSKISRNFIYQIPECPMFYMKGVASTELINRVKSRTKDHSFYYCPTPDGFSGIVLAGEVEDYAFTNEPLSIGGTTLKSQGQNYRRIDAKSRKEAQEFFNDNIRRTMHNKLASQPYSPLEPLMTADYLLTALDLPGWPGIEKIEKFSFERLIRCTFKYLESREYDDEVLNRELLILEQIAKQHDLLNLYNSLLVSTKRKIKKKRIYGFFIANFIQFEGTQIGINNIFDASLAVPFVFHFCQISPLTLFLKFLLNSYNIIKREFIYKKKSLPHTK